jgi:hypothetical protein
MTTGSDRTIVELVSDINALDVTYLPIRLIGRKEQLGHGTTFLGRTVLSDHTCVIPSNLVT